MILLGGYTRLTHSGLSMVDWAPIMGSVPPLSEQDWLHTFARYQEFPEYQHVNQGMVLSGFKSIFWIEYAHRMLGRLIGLVFFIPFVVFFFLRRLSSPLVVRLVIIFILGALQGGMGWYMVMSGLVEDPSVSQYRLTAHLILAVIIYGLIFRVGLELVGDPAERIWSRTESGHHRPDRMMLYLLIIITGTYRVSC